MERGVRWSARLCLGPLNRSDHHVTGKVGGGPGLGHISGSQGKGQRWSASNVFSRNVKLNLSCSSLLGSF